MRWDECTHDLPLVDVGWEIDLDIGKVLVANALWARDLSAVDPDHRSKLEALWGRAPDDGHWALSVPYRYWKTPDGAYHTEGVSGCGITYDGIAERSGVAWPWAGQKYLPGTALARDEEFARRNEHAFEWGQWQDRPSAGDSKTRPGPGDGVIVGSELATHVCMACWWEGDILVSVDGGQALAEDGWLQSIRLCRRPWHLQNGVWHLADRGVVGWVRTSHLPMDAWGQAPQGWEGLTLP